MKAQSSDENAPFVMLRGDDASFSAITSLLGRFAHRVELVHDLDQARELVQHPLRPTQGLLIPLRLHDDSSGIKSCLEAKADPLLSQAPVVGLTPSRDRAILQSFYGAGADSVIPVPFDAEALFFQLDALVRAYRSIAEISAAGKDTLALSKGAVAALDATQEAIVLFDTDYSPVFANAAARSYLIAERGITPDQLSKLSNELKPSLRAALTGKALPTSESKKNSLAATFTQLRGERGLPIGVAVRLAHLADIEYLSHNLEIALRSQALSLLGSAALLNSLTRAHGGYPLTPLHQFFSSISKETPLTPLGPLLTALTEVLDSVLPASLELTVHVEGEPTVSLRPSDATRLVGHLLLYTAMRCGKDGSIAVTAEHDPSAKVVSLLIVGEHGKTRLGVQRDYVEECLSNAQGTQKGSDGEKLVFGLEAAQTIADQYHLQLEYKTNASHTKVRMQVSCS